MLRTALRPKWLAMLALALALASGFAWLGSWQWDRSRAEADERELREQAAADPVALSEVLAPQQALDGEAGRATVLVSGDLVAADARVSPARELDGRTGGWVVAPVVVDGADPGRGRGSRWCSAGSRGPTSPTWTAARWTSPASCAPRSRPPARPRTTRRWRRWPRPTW